MRKLIMLTACIGMLGFMMPDLAWGAQKCILSTCPTDITKIGQNREYIRAFSNGNQCYSCDSDDLNASGEECKYDSIVGQKDSTGKVIGLYRCVDVTGPFDQWQSYNPGRMCENSDITKSSKNANKYYLYKGFATTDTNAGDHVIKDAGSDGCYYYLCKTGFMPNSDKTDCVKDTRKSDCENTGGNWSNEVCTCSQGKKLKQNTQKTKCECINSDYEYNSSSKACEETQAYQDKKQKESQAQRQKKCKDSGGEWAGGKCNCAKEKNLRLDSGKCVCIDERYLWNSDSKSCIITDAAALEEACKKAEGASWTGSACKCTQQYFKFNGKECVEDPYVVECRNIIGAIWNQDSNECECKDKKTHIINPERTECVESEEARIAREVAEAAEAERVARETSRSRIIAAGRVLDDISAQFKVSVWKNKDGGFNTARLASDSIAGVVLGTAGGLITSNVIKKNQIKGGFEDIKCTIGGQTVADWGDEFRVGIGLSGNY